MSASPKVGTRRRYDACFSSKQPADAPILHNGVKVNGKCYMLFVDCVIGEKGVLLYL